MMHLNRVLTEIFLGNKGRYSLQDPDQNEIAEPTFKIIKNYKGIKPSIGLSKIRGLCDYKGPTLVKLTLTRL